MSFSSLRSSFCPPHIWSKMFIVLLAVCLLTGISVQVAQAAPPADGPVCHFVRRGETLASIGRRYGVSYWAIARTNGIANPNRIYAGQSLVIPGGGWYQSYPYYGYGYQPSYGYGYQPSYGYGYQSYYGYGYQPSYGYGYQPYYGCSQYNSRGWRSPYYSYGY